MSLADKATRFAGHHPICTLSISTAIPFIG